MDSDKIILADKIILHNENTSTKALTRCVESFNVIHNTKGEFKMLMYTPDNFLLTSG